MCECFIPEFCKNIGGTVSVILTLNDLKNYKPKKDTYFVFGDPINHSLSPKLHSIYFNNNNIDADYIAAHIKPDELKEAIEIIRPYAKGVNLTIPHKKAIIPMLDFISEEAEKIGAVNTLVFNSGKITGYNTDCYGLLLTLTKYGCSLKDKSVLILGNGGVSEAFLYVCLKYTNNITVAGRNLEKTTEFCKNTPAVPCLISDIENEKFDVLLNGTPVGMSSTAEKSPVGINVIKNSGFVFDSIYNPLNTNLTVIADIYNIKNTSGLYMLIYQGLKAQELWGNSFNDGDAELIYKNLKNEFGFSKKNIVLTGYMGSGKTTASREIEKITGKITVDTDKLIEETEGLRISEIFSEYGEEYFRKLETQMTEKVCRLNGAVISTGGGIIKNSVNIDNLKKNGIVFFLNPDIEEITSRLIGSTTRPLIQNPENIKKIHEERLPLYKKYADYIISKNSTAESVGEILGITEK